MKNRFGWDWSQTPGTQFWRRPQFGRRLFFRHLGAALSGYFLLPFRPRGETAKAAVSTIGQARYAVFILMAGGPSHVDTFDLKEGPWTPAAFEPTSYGDLRFPRGLFPRLAEQISELAFVRSLRSWALVHSLAQVWVQIGRSPFSALAKVAPHIGSVVSLELSPQNQAQTLPTFVSLNTGAGPGAGYFPPQHAPFYVTPGGSGLSNTSHRDGLARFESRYDLLLRLDAEERTQATLGSPSEEASSWLDAARKMMYNGDVDRAFTFDAAERVRYGNSSFGNACITARNLLRSGLGTRFVQITVGGWDNHSGIYTGALNATNANSVARQFDAGLGALIADLRQDGLLEETLIVALGEFGRTVGRLNSQSGRDHFLQQSALFAGAGIRGGRAIGSTDSEGAQVAEPGWSRNREIHTEDIEATIYSALGIDWTTVRRDDPLGRGFEYVPFSDRDLYGPIHELWT